MLSARFHLLILYIDDRWLITTIKNIKRNAKATIAMFGVNGNVITCEDAILNKIYANSMPRGIARIDEKINCRILSNVQRFETSTTLNPINLKTESCLC